jgi:hypothetical protein
MGSSLFWTIQKQQRPPHPPGFLLWVCVNQMRVLVLGTAGRTIVRTIHTVPESLEVVVELDYSPGPTSTALFISRKWVGGAAWVLRGSVPAGTGFCCALVE